MRESGTVNSDGGQAAALFFTQSSQRTQRKKFSKLKAIILFFAHLFSVLSPYYSVLFHACPFLNTLYNVVHPGTARAFNENPITGL